MNTWKVILATLVIFGTGVVTGGLLVTHSERVKERQLRLLTREERLRPLRPDQREAPLPPDPANAANDLPPRQSNLLPSILRMEFLQRMERQMNLTTAQREKIEEILRAGQERSRQILEPVQTDLQRQVRTTRARIRDVLTEDQQLVFDDLMRPQPRMDRLESPPPGERRPQRQQPRPPEGQPRFSNPGPRPGQ